MKPRIALLIFALALQGCVVGTKKRYRENLAFSFAAGMIEANKTCIEKFNGMDPVSAAYQASNAFLRKQLDDCRIEPLKIQCECKSDRVLYYPQEYRHADPFNLLISTEGWIRSIGGTANIIISTEAVR